MSVPPRAAMCALLTATVAALLIVAPARSLTAQSEAVRAQLVVDVDWLRRNLQDPKLVLLHVGEKPEYDREHIPGARFITLQDVSAPSAASQDGTLTLELPDADALRDRLQALGVSDDSRIVVYWGNDWLTPSTRILFTLDWIGLGAQTSLLDGGMPSWKRAGQAVTADVASPERGRLTPRPTKDLVVDASFIQSLPRGGFSLVDARPGAFYDGVRESMHGKKGHIRGAGNFQYSDVARDDGLLRGADELRALFTAAGVKPGDTVVGYCFIGQYATAVLFAARTLGYDVRLYDGSFEDWAHRDLPVVATAARAPRP